tara:strand:- start:328 stop:513 length:186 start_codon:yes stop_codon:yes gene_type:complete
MRLGNEIAKLMLKNGYQLIRRKNHAIWKNDDGDIIVASRSPSCPYTIMKLEKRINKIKNNK